MEPIRCFPNQPTGRSTMQNSASGLFIGERSQSTALSAGDQQATGTQQNEWRGAKHALEQSCDNKLPT